MGAIVFKQKLYTFFFILTEIKLFKAQWCYEYDKGLENAFRTGTGSSSLAGHTEYYQCLAGGYVRYAGQPSRTCTMCKAHYGAPLKCASKLRPPRPKKVISKNPKAHFPVFR